MKEKLSALYGLLFQFTVTDLLLALSKDGIVHTSHTTCGVLAGMTNSSKDSPGGIDLITHQTMSRYFTTELQPATIEHTK